ncbi:ferritin-like domain-containing protein [Ulvibacter litoralis]|uniref:DUF2383 domain-containing protein n=1 Tax=Ulvibacter litoralis TaxID=227084 RepID=A0A1G7I607_9FLAO|nr:PA2169 family four-helix-bundle protein [Ulvibacter litoralis]GHC62441.1 hypothetical protein GCM10008083_29480 [Ulvibacter litoralis]SDF07976.1 conserved hypothetical protein [Ulvibacter litoralis]
METTKEKADLNIHNNLVNNLQGLLEKNYDAEKGFKKAFETTKNEPLRGFLKDKAVLHSRFANEINDELLKLNETPTTTGSTTGALHRGWIDVKTAFKANTDEAILEECIRGEKASMKEYEETLQKNNFPPQISGVLNNQLNDIKNTVSKVKKLEDIAENWG